MIRSAGVLCAVTSLPSPYGVGTLGKSAKKFIDFLADAGQTYWQILPIGPTGYGNSPYQALSSFAGNPYLIDLDDLCEKGYLKPEEIRAVTWYKDKTKVDYGILYNERLKLLRKATDRLAAECPAEYLTFLEKQSKWLKDYAVFMAIKQEHKGEPWQKWPKELRDHNSEEVHRTAEKLQDEVFFQERLQYLFFQQLKEIRTYANDKGIQILGDLPFYISADSADVWSDPKQFEIDGENNLTFVAGFAPDWGNPKGQKWGNPLFNWDYMRNNGYDWWIDRFDFTAGLFDAIRLDHFQGYLTYFAIPAKDEDAVNGHWRQGPGLELFRKLEEKIGKRQIIVEDLGQLTPEFIQMVKDSGYPGMKILQYAFDPNDPGSCYMPFQYEHNTVVYTGTHDNNTVLGWKNDPDQKARIERASQYIGISKDDQFTDAILRTVYGTVSDLAIVQLQDLLELGEEARMNDMSGKNPSWTWRAEEDACTPQLAAKLKEMMLLYCRNNWNAK